MIMMQQRRLKFLTALTCKESPLNHNHIIISASSNGNIINNKSENKKQQQRTSVEICCM